MRKPKFYKAVLQEIKGNVLDEVYPFHKGQMTMTERMGSEEAKCPESLEKVVNLILNV
jgi:hypothetical protein